jgi:hypothetical protein
MRVAIVNIGTIVSGDLRDPFAQGDTIILALLRNPAVKLPTLCTVASRRASSFDIVIDVRWALGNAAGTGRPDRAL